MTHTAYDTGKTRFYVPFILAFLVFSAVLATEYIIVQGLVRDIYRDQTHYYHELSRHLISGIEGRGWNSTDRMNEINAVPDLLGTATTPEGLNAWIVADSLVLNAYMDSSIAGGALLAGEALDNRVIETSVAKSTTGEYILIEAIGYNNSLIKNLEDISIAIIIILIVMIIFSTIPGVLMIESFTRRRRMAGSVLNPLSALSHEGAMDVLSGSRVTGCMVVSAGNEITFLNDLCRELLDLQSAGKGSSLASVTSLPDPVRKSFPPYPTDVQTDTVKVRSMTGQVRTLRMEIFPVCANGYVIQRIFTFTEQSVNTSSGGILTGTTDMKDGTPQPYSHLVDSIVHDMNNHLSGIIGAASLELDTRGPGKEGDNCRAIMRSAEKLTALSSDLHLLFSPEDDSGLKDPCEEINLIAEVMKRVLPGDVHFRVSGSCSRLISVRRLLLRDLIYNLSLNSTEMMNGEGRIQIDVSERTPAGADSTRNMPPGKRVVIRYSDGFIMPVALRDVLSSMQYSVSDVERQFGSTVGTIYRVLREMNGVIAFERGSGETVLCVLLEGYDRPEEGTGGKHEAGMIHGVSGLSVLVADAVEIVLHSTCEFLEHRGMSTTGASDGDRVMELLRENSYDAAVLDLNMPGIPTPSIVRYCQTRLPEMAVIITTGYAVSGPIRELIKCPSTDCLYKPHRPEMLVETIYSTLMRIQEEG